MYFQITKKLAGKAAGTAAWATTVGNEYGQVLQVVMTTSEGVGLYGMTQGIVKRYSSAGENPPDLLYVDRDCCPGETLLRMFAPWDITVRLDIWHFMRRFTVGLTSDSHPLYGTFMARLSSAIFVWDAGDLQALKEAKKAELLKVHDNVPDKPVEQMISKDELSRHCRRRTRGVEDTVKSISTLLSTMATVSDSCGVPLFDAKRMSDIWKVQKKHVSCIQDPPDVSLYTQVATMMKGGRQLPVYRCGRGSTSLESFHLHLNRFIPGTSANALHFQMYLLEGLTRWNYDRGMAALDVPRSALRSFDVRLKNAVNKASDAVLGVPQVHNYQPPGKYTGELIGIEYLLSQSGEDLTQLQDRMRSGEDTATLETVDEAEELDDSEDDGTVGTLNCLETPPPSPTRSEPDPVPDPVPTHYDSNTDEYEYSGDEKLPLDDDLPLSDTQEVSIHYCGLGNN